MREHCYLAFGVCFASDVALELPRAESGQAARFTLQASSGAWPALEAGPVIQEDGDDWVCLRVYAEGSVEIEWAGWLSFWIGPSGHNVRYRLIEDTYPTAFEAYVANFAISACLMLQGEELLHSTVVSLNGKGVGFLGSSGSGKSTLTAYLLTRGAELVTDDMLRITEDGDRLFAEPGQPRLKLFEEAAGRHLPGSFNQGRWNPVSEKYLFDIGSPLAIRPRQSLDALVFLTGPIENGNDKVELRALQGLELFQTLTASTMNYRLQMPDRLARQFEFASQIASRLPVFALHYPRRHDIFPEVVRVLDEQLRLRCEAL